MFLAVSDLGIAIEWYSYVHEYCPSEEWNEALPRPKNKRLPQCISMILGNRGIDAYN